MASDSKQYERALQNWEHLHAQAAYSVPQGIGRTAILCSYFTDVYSHYSRSGRENQSYKDIRNFRKEALQIADDILAEGGEVDVALNATAADAKRVLQDPEISDIITIGHGSLTQLYLNDTAQEGILHWTDVAGMADHLKRGDFVQRQCGHFTMGIAPVPLGLFAVDDHRHVFAAVGQYIEPRGLLHPHNKLITPVTDSWRLSYRGLKAAIQSPAPEMQDA